MKRPETSTVQLFLGVMAALVSSIFLSAAPFLIPAMLNDLELDLTTAGLIGVLPNLGMVATLVLWGGLGDRFGERKVLLFGLGLTTTAAVGAALSSSSEGLGAWLLLGGMSSASANVATGRIVIGWAPTSRRGLAMGIRQMAIPLGVMVSATAVPPMAQTYGVSGAMILPAAVCALALPMCIIGLQDPKRAAREPVESPPQAPANPYKASWYLLRVHTGSSLLAVPQFALQIFGLVWLMTDLGWSASAAGAVVAVSQLLGALGRVTVGAWTDALGRTRVIRYLAGCGVLTLLLLGFVSHVEWNALAVILFVIGTCLSVADNGPAFTAVAEYAGPFWSGRALGAQNTMQHVAGFLVGPTVASMIQLLGYPAVFALLALAPAAALPLVPPRDHRYENDS